jgi:DNA repair exonuclease SbcCD ATPase subunit
MPNDTPRISDSTSIVQRVDAAVESVDALDGLLQDLKQATERSTALEKRLAVVAGESKQAALEATQAGQAAQQAAVDATQIAEAAQAENERFRGEQLTKLDDLQTSHQLLSDRQRENEERLQTAIHGLQQEIQLLSDRQRENEERLQTAIHGLQQEIQQVSAAAQKAATIAIGGVVGLSIVSLVLGALALLSA